MIGIILILIILGGTAFLIGLTIGKAETEDETEKDKTYRAIRILIYIIIAIVLISIIIKAFFWTSLLSII